MADTRDVLDSGKTNTKTTTKNQRRQFQVGKHFTDKVNYKYRRKGRKRLIGNFGKYTT